MTAGPKARYRDREARFAAVAAADHAASLRLVGWRGLSFLVALGLGVAAENVGPPLPAALRLGAAAALLAFVLLVWKHRAVRRSERWHAELAALAREGSARLERAWAALPADAGAPAPIDHPYAADLDLFGPVSLGRLLGTPNTAPGRETLRAWLLSPAPEAEALERQEAVEALAGRHDFREELTARGRLAGVPDADGLRRLVRWCGMESYLRGRPFLALAAWGLPAMTLALAALWTVGVVRLPWFSLGPALMFGLSAATGFEVGARLEAASAGETELGRLADVFEAMAGVECQGALLTAIRTTLAGGARPSPGGTAPSGPDPVPAATALRRLGRRVAWAEARYSDMLHFFLQVFLLWDLHALRSLERWRERHGRRVEGWLDALGRGEAITALATLRADHPDWCIPTLRDEGPALFEATGLRHPLLEPGRAVPNDVTVGPPGSFLFVTGSNMSGKSTLLRAIGLGTVLARAGGPVPARRCVLPSLRVHTAMRVQDSLAEGVSQYMAELQRVRRVVEAARRAAGRAEAAGSGAARPGDGGPEPVLYLLDEPLQGTNEAERRVALRIVLRHLLAAGAVGAVATHDLALQRVEDLADAARSVHFVGEVRRGERGPELHFDYRLREGPATSTNALELLRAVGLGDDPGARPGTSSTA